VIQAEANQSDGAQQRPFVVVYWRLLGTVRPYLGQLVAALLCMILLAATTGLYAYMVGPLLKFLITRGEHGGFEILSLVPGLSVEKLDRDSLLAALPLFILGVALVKGISYFGQFYLMGMVGQRVVADLRDRMFDRLTSLSPTYFQRTPTGQILSRFTNDVYAIEQAVTYTVATYLRDGLQVAVLLVLAFILDWQLALITFVVMPLAIFPIVHFGKRLKQVSSESQSSLGNIADRLHETIRGMRIIQVFNAENFERGRFHQESQGYFRIMHRSFMVRALQSPVMEFLGAFGLAATIWYAGSRVTAGSLDPGHFVSFFAAVLMLYNPTKSLGRIGDLAAAGVAAAERVFVLLDEPDEIQERPGAVAIKTFEREIVFDRVSFSYGTVEVLKGVSFAARRGEVLAIVGASGAGKSTLVNLIPRFFDVGSGRISIDGFDIRDLQLRSLRGLLGMVTQEVLLFNDTVEGNVAYGLQHVDKARLREVARRAHALEFVESLPQGFGTFIGEGGIKLSGGQRQRIAIARALMRDAPILILDEATSSLDSESEREVQDALEVLMRDRTTVVIAHRLSTIRRADRILVLDGGRIVESGNHEQLLDRGGVYRRLYDLQFEENHSQEKNGISA
jgi:subfamily B ATP-binding cassette protein MsbA